MRNKFKFYDMTLFSCRLSLYDYCFDSMWEIKTSCISLWDAWTLDTLLDVLFSSCSCLSLISILTF